MGYYSEKRNIDDRYGNSGNNKSRNYNKDKIKNKLKLYWLNERLTCNSICVLSVMKL